MSAPADCGKIASCTTRGSKLLNYCRNLLGHQFVSYLMGVATDSGFNSQNMSYVGLIRTNARLR